MVQDTRSGITKPAAMTTGAASEAGLAGSAREGARIAGTSHIGDDSGPGPEVMAASSFEGETVVNNQGVMWQVIIHIVFVLSAVALAWADKLMMANAKAEESLSH